MNLIGRGFWPGLVRCDRAWDRSDGVMGTSKEDAMSMRWSKTERCEMVLVEYVECGIVNVFLLIIS